MRSAPHRPDGPKVVALGGGHGLAVALRAIHRYTCAITAVVSVADDGGSSGRLRRDLGVPPPGDLRKCLVALADDEGPWRDVFEHRFTGGELEGHSLGNLVLAGLTESLGDFVAALDEAAALLHAHGRVLPATKEAVVLKADVEGGAVEGQVAVSNSNKPIRRVELVPRDAPAHPDAVAAIRGADQVVVAPGSLYTSVLPVLCVPDLRDAVAETSASVVQVANLHPQHPETSGLDGTDHLRAVVEHGGKVGTYLYQRDGSMPVDEQAVRDLGAEPVGADVARPDGQAHDPERLAAALSAVL